MKPKDILLDEETLFKDETTLTPGYVPENILYRDEQLKALAYALKPGLRGVNPLNTLVYGPPGTGKTTAIKHVFEQVKESSGKLVTVYVNCEDANTRFSVFARIHERVFGTSPPDTGKPLESVKEKIFGKLAKEGKSLVVALDEIDQLFIKKNVDKILVDLLKAHTTYGYDKVGVIGALIDEGVISQLDAKTRSVFNPERVFFQPYARREVYDILSERVRLSFYQGVFSDKVLDAVVDRTFSAGDLRVGIDLLRRSGLLAERDSVRKVELGHVEEAFEGGSQKVALRNTIRSLDDSEKKLLSFIASAGDESSGSLYEAFRAKTGVGVRKYNEMVGKLEHLKLVDTHYVKGGRGRSRQVLLRFDAHDVLGLLK
ncbi:MAG: ORC1-type DNA replication protein [Candidatus Altiarchaeota archaeon]